MIWLGLIGAVLIARRSSGPRGATRGCPGRALLLAAMWLPSVLLRDRGARADGAGRDADRGGRLCAALALATDRSGRGPGRSSCRPRWRSACMPTDLALGSDTVSRSLLGPNPVLGVALLRRRQRDRDHARRDRAARAGRRPRHAAPRTRVWGFAVGGGGAGVHPGLGAPRRRRRRGADRDRRRHGGGARDGRCGAGGGGASRSCWSRPSLGLAALALLDLATGGDAHFSRSVLEAGGLHDIADIAERRVRLSYRSLGRGAIPVPRRVRADRSGGRLPPAPEGLLAAAEGAPGVQAAVYGLLAAVLIGALTNDSGPIILLIGSSYLLFAAVYLACSAPPGRTDPCDRGASPRSRRPPLIASPGCGSPWSRLIRGLFPEA